MPAVHSETEHAPQSLINDVACGGMCAEQFMTSVTLPFQLWGLCLATCHSYKSSRLGTTLHVAVPWLAPPTNLFSQPDWLMFITVLSDHLSYNHASYTT